MGLYTGKECVYCHEVFKDGDDIVVCPVCGAPHHRECYNKIHKCALESSHNTEDEWCRKNTVENVPAEQNENSQPVQPSQYVYQAPDADTFSVYGFMGKDESIDDVSAPELADFVGRSSYYYLTKFKKMNETGRNTWNFSAFVFNFLYFFYRKLYKQGIILLVIAVITSLPTFMIMDHFAEFVAETSQTEIVTPKYAQSLMMDMFSDENDPEYDSLMFWLGTANVMSMIRFVVAFAAGFTANRNYMNHCIKKIKYTRAALKDYRENPNYRYTLHMLGGVTVQKTILIAAGYMFLQMAASFILISRHIV